MSRSEAILVPAMEQGTAEWHRWRRDGIGASEVAAVLGVSKYKTAYQLWCEKTSDKDLQISDNAAMARGRAHEPMIRAAYSFSTGLDFEPVCFEHPLYPFMRASLDGWADGEGIEIKSMGTQERACATEIPSEHYFQMQHQMLVCAVDHWTYLRTWDGVNMDVRRVAASAADQARILGACIAFWERVTSRTPPAYADGDWIPTEDNSLRDFVMSWRCGSNSARKANRAKVLNQARALGFRRCVCAGVKISTDPARLVDSLGGGDGE